LFQNSQIQLEPIFPQKEANLPGAILEIAEIPESSKSIFKRLAKYRKRFRHHFQGVTSTHNSRRNFPLLALA